MQLDAWGEPMWKQDAGQWLNRRSEDAEVCVAELIDRMITESKKIYAGTDMMRSPSGTRTRRSSTSRTGTRGSRTASSSPWAPRAPARFTTTLSPATRPRTPGPRLARLRGPRVRHVFQLRAGMSLPLRRRAPDLRPGDAQGGVGPHGADLDGHKRPLDFYPQNSNKPKRTFRGVSRRFHPFESEISWMPVRQA